MNTSWNWDYDLPADWKPTTKETWEWYLVRKLNIHDFTGFTLEDLKKHYPTIEQKLDPGMRFMLNDYFQWYDTHH